MTREEALEKLQNESPGVFLENHLFDRIPHVFQDNRAQYLSWKRTLSAKLEVDAACITVVGGAAFGYSLNPNKNFKAFGDTSDVDVAVISAYHFAVAWRHLRDSTQRLRVNQRTKIAWDEHAKRFIYWGTVATDRLLGVLPFGLQWLAATTHMASLAPTKGREVNLRIYIDYESLRAYQLRSITKAKQASFI